MSVNKVILLGNLGDDPRTKVFDNGGKIAQFSLATSTKAFTTKDGRTVPERTEWHNILINGKLADIAEKYLVKGSKIYAEGEIRSRSYDDAQGVKRYITEIYVSNFEMLTPKPSGQTAQSSQSAVDNYEQRQNNNKANNDEQPDDLPF